jgi:hypothetical protein
MQLYAILIKYSSKQIREEIIKYISIDICGSKTYFTRRLFFPFLKIVIEQYSSNFLVEQGIIEKSIKYLQENTLGVLQLLKLLPKFYFMMSNDPKVKYQLEFKLKQLKLETKDSELLQVVIC